MRAITWKPGFVVALLLSLVISSVLATTRAFGRIGRLSRTDRAPRPAPDASAVPPAATTAPPAPTTTVEGIPCSSS